ncbi:MAG: citrate transporter [Deltaproteobacteria bacterium]|nr:citrate transporter [Deltaproteobacteria bacterium]
MPRFWTLRPIHIAVVVAAIGLFALPGLAEGFERPPLPMIGGIPVDFILFGMTLVGVALFHHYTLQVAATGLTAVVLYNILFSSFKHGLGVAGFFSHLGHEWVVIVNLFCLLTGFALLANHFEESEVPKLLPNYLPDDWKGGFALLVMVFVLSSFLDNIAAAMIGGAMAQTVFNRKVHIGYIAAIVAASNAGGAGSVVGDTTTTMMWISGISPFDVLHAYVAAGVALVVFGIPAALQQHKHSPILKDAPANLHIDWSRMGVVAVILGAAIAVNVLINVNYPAQAESFPFIGVAVWGAILITAPWRRPTWSLLPEAVKGSCFLLALVLSATMMPVEKLPAASWHTSLGLGFLSSVFDNIPLTALAIKQGGYDWGMLAYSVGFGGSMIWFGSSAGVAITNIFPEAKSVGRWLASGWHVAIGYVVGFFVLLAIIGWHPHAPKHEPVPADHGAPASATAPATGH